MITTTAFKPKLWVPGDWNAFFGFGTNILVNLLTLSALLRFVLQMPDELVFQRTLKGLRNTIVLPRGWEVAAVSQSGTIGTDHNGRAFVSLVNLNAENNYKVTIRAKRSA